MEHQQNPNIAGFQREREVEIDQRDMENCRGRERQNMCFATWNEAATVSIDGPNWKRKVNGPMGNKTLPLQNPLQKYGLHRTILETVRQIHTSLFPW